MVAAHRDGGMEVRTLDSVIGEASIFRKLSRDHLALIAGCASNTGFSAGEQVFREGDAADVFFLVRRGLIAIDAYVPHLGRLTIETAGPGDIVGWSWLLPPYRWHFTGRVVEAVRAVQFDGACLRGKAEADPALGYELTRRFAPLLVSRLQATRHRLVDVYDDLAARHPRPVSARADET